MQKKGAAVVPRSTFTCPHRPAGTLPKANYVVRTNVTGGGAPRNCTAPQGQWVLVLYTAV